MVKSPNKSGPRSIHTKHQPAPSLPLLSSRQRYKALDQQDDLASRLCGNCGKLFSHHAGLRAHTQQKAECRRWMKKKAPEIILDVEDRIEGRAQGVLPEDEADAAGDAGSKSPKKRKRARSSVGTGREESMPPPGEAVTDDEVVEGPAVEIEAVEEEVVYEEPGDVYQDQTDVLYQFIPAPPSPQDEHRDHGEASGSSGPPPHRQRQTAFQLDDDDDERVIEELERGGKRIRMGEGLYQRWRDHFETAERERVEKEKRRAARQAEAGGTGWEDIGGINSWAPFASKTDWMIAKWAVDEGIGNGQLDRLLEIPGVRIIQ